MDNQAYLNQISSEVRPTKKQTTSLPKKILLGLAGVFVLVILLAIIKNVFSTNSTDSYVSLKLRINTMEEVIKEYQPKLKSSDLRSLSASLDTILSTTETTIDEYIDANIKFEKGKTHPKLEEIEATHNEELTDDLFTAKINGLLDRTYAHKITYEITLIMNDEAKIINKAKDDYIKTQLTNSYNSLSTLYESFNTYSEAK